MIKAVIFDMDGVLVDTEEAYQERRKNFMISQGYQVDNIDFMRFVGETFETLWSHIEPYVNVDCHTLQERYISYKAEHPLSYGDVIIQGVKETIEALYQEGYKLAVASASSKKDIYLALDTIGVRQYFDSIISARELPKSKPDPMVYIKTLEALELSSSEAVVVEDSPVGIQAAKSANLYTFAFHQPHYRLDQSKSDEVITALPNLIERLKIIDN